MITHVAERRAFFIVAPSFQPVKAYHQGRATCRRFLEKEERRRRRGKREKERKKDGKEGKKNLKIERRRTDRKKNRNKRERERERERNTGYDVKGDTRRLSIMMQINVTRGILRSASIFFLFFFLFFFLPPRALQVHQSVPISSRAKTSSPGKISFASELSIQKLKLKLKGRGWL